RRSFLRAAPPLSGDGRGRPRSARARTPRSRHGVNVVLRLRRSLERNRLERRRRAAVDSALGDDDEVSGADVLVRIAEPELPLPLNDVLNLVRVGVEVLGYGANLHLDRGPLGR